MHNGLKCALVYGAVEVTMNWTNAESELLFLLSFEFMAATDTASVVGTMHMLNLAA